MDDVAVDAVWKAWNVYEAAVIEFWSKELNVKYKLWLSNGSLTNLIFLILQNCPVQVVENYKGLIDTFGKW